MNADERIIKYLDNELITEEKTAFEKEMESSRELRDKFQKYVSVKEEIEKLKGLKLNPDYIDSILPEFHFRMLTGKKETIRKSLSYAFGVMLMFIIAIAILRIFFNNHNDPKYIVEFALSLNENQKVELLENLNGNYAVYNLIPDNDLIQLLEADLEINSDVAEAYGIGYKEIIGKLTDNELEIVYQEILKKTF
ncbi:MAG: hypothetical protein OEM46_07255 [Ignavibacteria bacterium]|nr:hypothetical protein [Ignavibacteria bacterium]